MRTCVAMALIAALTLAARAGEPAPPVNDDPEVKRLLDSMTDSEKAGQAEVLRVTDRRLRSQLHFQTAKRMYEDRLYEDAREQAELAVQYDPANAEAKELLRLSEAVLAVRRSQIRSMTEHLEAGQMVKVQEQLMKLQSHLDRAKVLVEQATGPAAKGTAETSESLAEQHRLLDEADRQLVRAREVAKWMPAQVSVKGLEEEIEVMLDHVFKERKAREAKLEVMGRERAAEEALKSRENAELFKQRRIRMLMDRARMLYDREDYEEAGRLSRRILDIDPTNADAIALGTSCRVKAIDRRAARTADIKKEAIKDWVELSKRATIPHSRLMVYPSDWAEITARDSVEERRLQEPEWQRKIRAALEKEVDIEFVEQPLDECINYLRGLTDASIITDNKAFAGGVDPKTPITMKLSKTRLDLALKWILKMAKMDYALKNGAIFISTPNNLQGELVQKIYDVRDLTFQIEHFPGPQMGLNEGATGGAGAVITAPPPSSVTTTATLQDMIKRVVRPNSWAMDGVQITESGGRLIVNHQPEVHAQISQLLEEFRKSQTLQVHVEARYVDVRQGFLEEIGVDWGGNPNGVAWQGIGQGAFDGNHPSLADPSMGVWDAGPGRPNGAPGEITQRYQSWGTGRTAGTPLGDNYLGPGEGLSAMFVYLGNWQAQVLLRAVQKESRGTVLFAPRLTMFNNQRAHIFVGRQTSYVSGWSSSGDVLTPEVSTAIMDGVALDVRPIVSHDRRYITLELRPTLVRPVGESTFTRSRTGDPDDPADPDDPDNPDLIGQQQFTLPELEVRTIRTVVTVPDGGTVLLSGLMTETQSDQHQGIPFLMNLPVVGRLFGNNYKETDRRNLLILVNARLILFSEEEQQL